MNNRASVPVYEGNEPYVFVSYAHADEKRVLPLLAAMGKMGFRIWYDYGIGSGKEWADVIADHLKRCSVFMFLASVNSVKSENCLDEISLAKDTRKPSLMVFLDGDAALPSGADMRTARFQRVFLFQRDGWQRLIESEILAPCRAFSGHQVKMPSIKQKKLPKGLVPAIVGVAALLLAVLLLIPPVLDSIRKPETPELTMSDDLLDYTLMLEEKLYRLPCDYTEFTDDGWVLTEGDTAAFGGEESRDVVMTKGDKRLELTVTNPGGNAKKLEECQASAVACSVEDGVSITLPQGITFQSDEAAIRAAYGTPDTRRDTETSVTLYYNKLTSAPTINSYVCFELYSGEAQEQTRFVLRCQPDAEKTPTSQERPSYLTVYTKPDGVLDNVFSSIFSLGGEVYRLPVPVDHLISSGWELEEPPNYVVAYGERSVTAVRDGVRIELTLSNHDVNQTTVENCLVTELTLEAQEGLDFWLTDSISLNSTEQQVRTGLGTHINEFDVTKTKYAVIFQYTDATGSKPDVRIIVDTETGKVSAIELKNESL